MSDYSVKIRAYSPGKRPILVVELPTGGLCATYFETGYDLGQSKPVREDWMYENAIGRHSFVEVSPPERLSAASLADYVREELLEDS